MYLIKDTLFGSAMIQRRFKWLTRNKIMQVSSSLEKKTVLVMQEILKSGGGFHEFSIELREYQKLVQSTEKSSRVEWAKFRFRIAFPEMGRSGRVFLERWGLSWSGSGEQEGW